MAFPDVLPALVGEATTWVQSLEYLAVLLLVAGDGVIPIFPGETSVVVAGVFAAAGDLDLWLVILAGAVGAVIGDSAAFWIGRSGGPWIRRVTGRMVGAHRVQAAEHMVHRQGDLLVFTGRFLTVLRLGINVACGAGRMPFRRFLLIDSAAALVWSAQAAVIGYLSGRLFPGKTWLAVVVALAIAGCLILVIVNRERRRVLEERRLMAEEGASAS